MELLLCFVKRVPVMNISKGKVNPEYQIMWPDKSFFEESHLSVDYNHIEHQPNKELLLCF